MQHATDVLWRQPSRETVQLRLEVKQDSRDNCQDNGDLLVAIPDQSAEAIAKRRRNDGGRARVRTGIVLLEVGEHDHATRD